MKVFFALVAMALVTSPAFAGTQQNKMKDCNVQAKGMKGAERKAFMKTCLSAAPTATASAADAAATTGATAATDATPATKSADPKQRMKDCNMAAKGKKGDERKSFMSSCLKNDASAPAKM